MRVSDVELRAAVGGAEYWIATGRRETIEYRYALDLRDARAEVEQLRKERDEARESHDAKHAMWEAAIAKRDENADLYHGQVAYAEKVEQSSEEWRISYFRSQEEVVRLNAELEEQFQNVERMIKADETLERRGYRKCDIPACNCNGYHESEAHRCSRSGKALRLLRDCELASHVRPREECDLEDCPGCRARALIEGTK